MKTVVVSGGFDPLHVGHLNLISMARAFGRVVVIVDSDAYVQQKHELRMPQAERLRIIRNLADVDAALPNHTVNGDCSDLLSHIEPDIFLVGPDKIIEVLPERTTCLRLGIRVLKAEALHKKHSSRDYGQPRWKNPPVCCSALVSHPSYPGLVLLCRRTDNKKWDLPGGFLEMGETLEDCIVREFFEECGASLENPVYFGSTRSIYNDGREVLLVAFKGTILDPADITEPDGEFCDVMWSSTVPEEMNNEDDRVFLGRYFAEGGF